MRYSRFVGLGVVVAAIAAGCGSQEAPPPAAAPPASPPAETTTAASPAPPPTESTSPAETAPPTETSTDDPIAIPQSAGLLDGAYSSGLYAPPFTFLVDQPAFTQGGLPNLIPLDLGATAVTTPLTFFNDTASLADPESTQNGPGGPDVDDVGIDSAESLVKWLTTNPRLKSTKPVDIEIGGVPATEVVVEVAEGQAYESPAGCGQGVKCVLLVVMPDIGFSYFIEPGRPLRVQVLDVDDRTVFITTEPPRADYEGGIASADQLLDTVEWGS